MRVKWKIWISIRQIRVIYVPRSFRSPFEYKISALFLLLSSHSTFLWSCSLLLQNECNFGFVLTRFWFQFTVFFFVPPPFLLKNTVFICILYYLGLTLLFCCISIEAQEQRLKAALTSYYEFERWQSLQHGQWANQRQHNNPIVVVIVWSYRKHFPIWMQNVRSKCVPETEKKKVA